MLQTARDTRILIVGAGPSGMAAALELARRGFAPVIVEQGADLGPPEQSRALAVNLRTMQLLEPSGVSARIAAEAIETRALEICAGSRSLLSVDVTEIGDRRHGMRMLPQIRTETLLLEALAARGITPRWQTTLRTLEDVEAEPAAVLVGADGRQTRETFDIVIGADGAHSAVRHAAGFGFAGKAFSETFYLADFDYGHDLGIDRAEVRFLDPGVIGRLLVTSSTVRYISTLADFRDRIEHPAEVVAVPWESEFHVSFRHVDRMSRGSVFLIGDAAHIHSPVGGRGMNLGIEDACWLAWLISQGRQREFSDLRLPSVRAVVSQTETLTRMILMRNPLMLAARNALLPLAAALPFVRRRAMAGVHGVDTPPPPWLDSEAPGAT